MVTYQLPGGRAKNRKEALEKFSEDFMNDIIQKGGWRNTTHFVESVLYWASLYAERHNDLQCTLDISTLSKVLSGKSKYIDRNFGHYEQPINMLWIVVASILGWHDRALPNYDSLHDFLYNKCPEYLVNDPRALRPWRDWIEKKVCFVLSVLGAEWDGDEAVTEKNPAVQSSGAKPNLRLVGFIDEEAAPNTGDLLSPDEPMDHSQDHDTDWIDRLDEDTRKRIAVVVVKLVHKALGLR
jgi:hypothetical protein